MTLGSPHNAMHFPFTYTNTNTLHSQVKSPFINQLISLQAG